MPLPDTARNELAWRLEEANTDVRDFIDAGHLSAANVDLAHIDPSFSVNEEELLNNPPSASDRPDIRPSFPRPYLSNEDGPIPPYTHLEDARVVTIGAGAAALIMGSYATIRGVSAENMTFIDPRGRFGGLWTEASTQVGGFNNPASLRFSRDYQLSIDDRRGANMHEFLRNIAASHLSTANMLRDSVVTLTHDHREGTWLAETEQGYIAEADYVFIATGLSTPRSINSNRIRSNLDTINEQVPDSSLTVERYQRELSEEELSSGRNIVMIGLGNSTAAMLHQIQTYETRYGVEVPYTLLSDLPSRALENPTAPVHRGKSLFRDPSVGYLTGYSGDLARDRDSYYRALDEGKVIGNVTQVNFDTETQQLVVTGSDTTLMIEQPLVFALLGRVRDDRLLRQLDCMTKEDPLHPGVETPLIRPSDGAVHTREHGSMSNVFAFGAVAITPRSPNAGVIPGILPQTPKAMLTVATRQNPYS